MSARPGRPRRGVAVTSETAPLDEREIYALQALLAALPTPLEPLDLPALDGFLCGVIVQPEPISPSRWLPFVTDVDGRAPKVAADLGRIHDLVLRRETELRRSIEARRWFDPWVFALETDGLEVAPIRAGAGDVGDAAAAAAATAVRPWAAGFAAALETFPALLGSDGDELTAPLALVYRYLDADHLDDADALRDEIESLEPPADLTTAIEELVRATLLLADVAARRL